jgi:type II secretory pathway component PulC
MIEKSFLKSKLSDINSLLTQARGIPIRNPDGTLSFKIVDIEPGGVFAHLGVQNNDVISQINGQNIKNMNQIMNFFGKIQNMSKLNLLIQRSGEEVQQNYTIK